MPTNSSARTVSAVLAAFWLASVPATSEALEPPATLTIDAKILMRTEERVPEAGLRTGAPTAAAFPAVGQSAPRLSQPGELLEEEVGAWEWAYSVTNQGRGNIYRVTTTTNLYEHRLHLYLTAPTPAFFVIYRGEALIGTYTLVQATDVPLEPGNAIYSSGACNYLLEAGYYYYIGAAWQGTVMYARSNAPPPQSVTFGTVETSVPSDLPHYPPIEESSNTLTGYAPCHQIMVTGQEPPPDAPGRPGNLLVAPVPASFAVDLSWTNPSVTTAGTPLEDLEAICIQRDGSLLTRLTDVEIGAAMSWTDRSVSQEGCHDYRVLAYNEEGFGWPASQPVWAGAGTGVYQTSGIVYDWMEISGIGTDVGLVVDDQTTAPIPIGFDFPFYGNWYNSVRICSNGFLSFVSSSSYPYNMRIPHLYAPNGFVAPYWDDLDPSVHGAVYTYLDAGPRFIVEWHDLPCFGLTEGHYTFQAILYPTGGIEFYYQTVEPGVPDAASIGIENETGRAGMELCYCLHGPFHPEPGSAIGFARLLAPASVQPARPAGAALSWPTPNPSSGAARCLLTLPADGRVDLRVCDAAGRLVRQLPGGHLPAGSHPVSWDGRDAAGRLVPSGTYFLRVEGGGPGAEKIIVLR